MDLVKRMVRFPAETKECRSIYDRRVKKFSLESVLKEIAVSFFEKGEPVESVSIARRLGLEKAEKFARVLKSWLGPMIIYEIKEGRGGRGRAFVSPSALIFIPEEGGIMDFTEFDEFYENLDKFSRKVMVNILKEPISLEEFLLSFKGREREAVKKLSELCKGMVPGIKKYELPTLKEYISREFFLEDISQRTREARYKFKNLNFNFVLWYGTGNRGDEFFHDDVTCEYVETGVELPEEIKEAAEEILRRKKKEAEKRSQVFDNHPGYKLLGIRLERVVEEGRRKHKIHLTFGPTDFYTSVCTNQSIDEPILKSEGGYTTIRRKYIKGIDLNEPDYLARSFLSNMFGVALATITEDGKIVLQRRSRQVYMGPMRCTLATAENMIRGTDEDEEGKPNPFFTARRCVKEELGEEVGLEDIAFLGFGVRLDNLLPQALGMVKLRTRSSDLDFVKARDRWEGKNFLEDFTPHSLKKYFKVPELITDTARLTILLALIYEFGFENVERGLNS
jgi:hypothetical protein